MSPEINRIREQVLMKVDTVTGVGEDELKEIIKDVLRSESNKYMSAKFKAAAMKSIFNSIKRFDVLQQLLDDDSITEVMVNGPENIFVERNGKIEKAGIVFESREKLLDVVQRIAARSNKLVNESMPIVDTRLEDGSRVNIVMNPIAIEGPAITIRKFYDDPLTIEKLIEFGALDNNVAEFLEKLVISRYNIFISGGTGSGKTTFLNALSNFIPKKERIVTIEDSAELKLMGVENIVRMEARNANLEGKNEVSIRDMIKASLRMRPDRIVVGEVRAGEALDMLQAMNTGHDGSLSTGHSNGPQEMLLRLETMVLMACDMPVSAIRSQIASAIDIIVHLGRLRDGSRKVLKICEVTGMDENGESTKININTLYEFEEMGVNEKGHIMGYLKGSEQKLEKRSKLLSAGYSL